jgi:nucleotide-binding universal stress UspA family protein
MFKNILCAIDFSDTSARALTHAAALATQDGARLTVLHVAAAFEDASGSEPADEPGSGLVPGSHGDVLAKVRDAIAHAGATAIDPRPLALEGHTAELIASSAEVVGADLLVMGTHGRSGFHRLFLGSVAEKVLHLAPCPVLTVPPLAPEAMPAPLSFTNVLCPVDFSPSATNALSYALRLARQTGGRLTVLHAVEYMDDEELHEDADFSLRDYRQRVVDRARIRLQGLLAAEQGTGCEIEELVVVNRAYRAILDRAAAAPTDLIAMGTQGFDGVELMLYGSTTEHVVRRATCPVLAVRP